MTKTLMPSPERHQLCKIFKADGSSLKLELQQVVLSGTLLPVGARLKVQHLFRSAESRPTEVIYAFTLPRDGAMKGFHVRGETFEIQSELRETKQAEQIYEDALEKGHLATLAREYQDGVVNISLGNLRPRETVIVTLDLLAGTELHDNGFRFRFPFTLPMGYHPQGVASVDDSGGVRIDLPPEFGDMILPSWTNESDRLHRIGLNLKLMTAGNGVSLSSPSHTIRMEPNSDGYTLKLADVEQIPDHDLVLDIRFDQPRRMYFSGKGPDGLQHFIFAIPSSDLGQVARQARRVTFVVDHSGSMEGRPLQTVKALLNKTLAQLSSADEFNIVAFESTAHALWDNPKRATQEAVQEAHRFLTELHATGGTELLQGLELGVKCSHTGTDVVLITDGSVFGTEAIIGKARELGMRIHVLGICEEGQERFLNQLSRQTGGVCRTILPGESIEQSCSHLASILGSCVASDLRVTSKSKSLRIEPNLPQAVFAQCPLVVMGDLDPHEVPQITLSYAAEGTTKSLLLDGSCAAQEAGETVALLRGSRLITDYQAFPETDGVKGKEKLKALSQRFGLASQEMSLVAVIKRPGDELLEPPTTKVVAVGTRREYFQSLQAPGTYNAHSFLRSLHRRAFRFLLRDDCNQVDLDQFEESPLEYGDAAKSLQMNGHAAWIADAAYLLTRLHVHRGRWTRRLRREFSSILARLEGSLWVQVDNRCQALLTWLRNHRDVPLTPEQLGFLSSVINSVRVHGQLDPLLESEFWKIVSGLPDFKMPGQ
jgi:Ca-activated chloride channel family protein